MRLEIDIPEHHYNNIMSIDSISLGRAPYKGIIMYAINAIKQGKVLEQEPTTKKDLGVEEVTALAEWTTAYSQGYADGVKSVNICPYCGEYIGEEE